MPMCRYLWLYIVISIILHLCHTKTSCGTDIYCYYIDIYPFSTIPISEEVIISDPGNQLLTFDIYFTPRNEDCLSPSISFDFELIDYDTNTEWLQVLDNEDVLIKQCNGGSQNMCPQRSQCLLDLSLGIDKVAIDEPYKITVIKNSGVDPYCYSMGSSPIQESINALLQFKCNIPTPSPTTPTAYPTPYPTTTLPPTTSPTPYPTAPTASPTPSPTATPKVNCGTNRYCYVIDMYPIIGWETSNTIAVAHIDDNDDTYFEIHINIHGNHCIEPSISFVFEEIDFSTIKEEFIRISDDDGSQIEKCTGSMDYNCGNWIQCLTNRKIGSNQINDGDSYIITLFEPYMVDALCSHDYSINAQLTFTCSEKTIAPTRNPTSTPTPSPTPAPTTFPTPSPTFQPSSSPTTSPTISPSDTPTLSPSQTPTHSTVNPTKNPSLLPTFDPTTAPSLAPTQAPPFKVLVIPNLNHPTSAPFTTTETTNIRVEGQSSKGKVSKTNSSGFIMGNYIIFITISGAMLFVCCIIIFIFIVLYKKKKKQLMKEINSTDFDISEEGHGQQIGAITTSVEMQATDHERIHSMSNQLSTFFTPNMTMHMIAMDVVENDGILLTPMGPSDDAMITQQISLTPEPNVNNTRLSINLPQLPRNTIDNGKEYNQDIEERTTFGVENEVEKLQQEFYEEHNEPLSDEQQQADEEDEDDLLYDDNVIENNMTTMTTTTGGNDTPN